MEGKTFSEQYRKEYNDSHPSDLTLALERGESCLSCGSRTIAGRCALDPINKQPRKTDKDWCSAHKLIDWYD